MFALSAARDFAIAIIVTVLLIAAMSGLQSREERKTPTIHYGVALSPQNRDAANRAAGLSPKAGGAASYAMERGR